MPGWPTMLIAVALLCIACTFSIAKIIMFLTANDDEKTEVDAWLEEQDLKQYQPHFKEKGKQTIPAQYLKFLNCASSYSLDILVKTMLAD